MTRIALIVPNMLLREDYGDISDPPIGIASIGGYLERHGYEVIIIDALGENIATTEVLNRLADFHPQAIGIGCNYSPLHNPTTTLARAIRESLGSKVPVFVGGNHATSLPGPLLRQSEGSIDCIVRGEGESTTLTYLTAVAAGQPLERIPGVSFLQRGHLVTNAPIPLVPDIGLFGIPAYHLLPMSAYKRYNIVSMRGCPFSCTFCASTVLFGRKVRYRPIMQIVDEIEYLQSTWGDRHFWFSDDTFTINRAHTTALFQELNRRRLKISWSCLTTIHAVNAGFLAMMQEAGCKYISYGIETGHQDFLDRYVGKRISPQEMIRTSALTHAEGIPHYGFFIFGFPGETWGSIQDTYDLIVQCKMNGGGMNILIPLPGTKLWNMLFQEQRKFSLDEIEWDRLFARLPQTGYESFTARLAARWCELGASELIEACRKGQDLFTDSPTRSA